MGEMRNEDHAFEKDSDGIYIIEEGQCEIISSTDGFIPKTLRRWDFFGESELLKVIVGVEFLLFRATHTSETSKSPPLMDASAYSFLMTTSRGFQCTSSW